EVVLLDFNHFYNMSYGDCKNLASLINTALVDTNGNSLMIPRGTDLTLGKLQNMPKNHNVLVFFEDNLTLPDTHFLNAYDTLWQSDVSSGSTVNGSMILSNYNWGNYAG